MFEKIKSGFYKHPSQERAKALWARVEAFEIDEPGAPAPFSVRLAREQNWTIELAREAVEEYKRFMFLAVAAGHPVTPSATVDEVWHLHLIYTRSYWEDFCVKVLDRIIHHDPGNGKEGERGACKPTVRAHAGKLSQVLWRAAARHLGTRKRPHQRAPALCPTDGPATWC
ncbi:MAG: hypothetical protein IPL73_01245 [Candidatus Obscuribacter sp.]|nr:hypothetical protein [Candidatus Obscuribacter sp.]